MYLLKQTTANNKMKLTKTTLNHAEKRNMCINLDELDDVTLITIVSQEETGYEQYLEYIANEDGTFTYKYNEGLVSQETKEELPAFIQNEKQLRQVIEFIAKEAA